MRARAKESGAPLPDGNFSKACVLDPVFVTILISGIEMAPELCLRIILGVIGGCVEKLSLAWRHSGWPRCYDRIVVLLTAFTPSPLMI